MSELARATRLITRQREESTWPSPRPGDHAGYAAAAAGAHTPVEPRGLVASPDSRCVALRSSGRCSRRGCPSGRSRRAPPAATPPGVARDELLRAPLSAFAVGDAAGAGRLGGARSARRGDHPLLRGGRARHRVRRPFVAPTHGDLNPCWRSAWTQLRRPRTRTPVAREPVDRRRAGTHPARRSVPRGEWIGIAIPDPEGRLVLASGINGSSCGDPERRTEVASLRASGRRSAG